MSEIYILPDPLGDVVDYWQIDENFLEQFHPVVKTFLELTKQTCPHPKEQETYGELLTNLGCQKDNYGNFYKMILKKDGTKPITMFTSHLDTADSKQSVVNHLAYTTTSVKTKKTTAYIETDGTTILGADCKAGTALQFVMMEKEVPGLYYFFLGEEVGLKGSRWLADNWSFYPDFHHIKHCVSFDRMRNHSIISKQQGNTCCSKEFVDKLIEEFKKQNILMEDDPTGSCTDSLAFTSLIPECTNISVGYVNQHRNVETQDITFLSELAEALPLIDWESLPAIRTPEERKLGKYSNSYQSTSSPYSKRDYRGWDDYSQEDWYERHDYSGSSKSRLASFYEDMLESIPYLEKVEDLYYFVNKNPKEFLTLLGNAMPSETILMALLKELVKKIKVL